MKTPQQMADRYKSGIAGAGAAYQDGVRAVTQNPATAAIAAAPKYEARVMEAISEGRYQAGLQGVTLAGWQQAAIAASGKLTQSAQTAAPKYLAYATAAAPIIAQVQQAVRSMPNVTEQDAKDRMIANMDGMKALRGVSKRGRAR